MRAVTARSEAHNSAPILLFIAHSFLVLELTDNRAEPVSPVLHHFMFLADSVAKCAPMRFVFHYNPASRMCCCRSLCAQSTEQTSAWSVMRPMCFTTGTSKPSMRYVLHTGQTGRLGFRWKNDLNGLSIFSSFCERPVVGTLVDCFVAEQNIEKRLRISTATRAHRLVLLLVVALLHLLDGSVTPPTECVFTLHGVLLCCKEPTGFPLHLIIAPIKNPPG